MLKWAIAIFIALPILGSTVLSPIALNYPAGFETTLYVFGILIFGLAVAQVVIIQRFKNFDFKVNVDLFTQKLLMVFGYGIILLCVLDIAVRGPSLFDPDHMAYFNFTPFERRLRHLSSLVWVLGVLSFVIRSIPTRILFFVSSILFPLLFLDRNRMLFALFGIGISFLVFDQFKRIRKLSLAIALICGLFAIILFAWLGQKRNSDGAFASIYEKSRQIHYAQMQAPDPNVSYQCPIPDHLPVSDWFLSLPSFYQRPVLYVASPIFNLATQNFCKIQNGELLKSQLIPLYPKTKEILEVPLVTPYLNVGTEFFPFFLAGGWPALIFMLLLTVLLVQFLIWRLCRKFCIFEFLVLVRVLYCCVFINFAPQLYTWNTIGFVLILGSMKFVARFGPKLIESKVRV